MGYLFIENISKKIGDKPVLRSVNASLNKGEVLAITGPPGSGKTTLLKIVAGLVPPTTGKIYLEGKDITYVPPHERGFSMVFEIPPVYPDRTGFENIAFPLRLKKLDEEEIKRRVHAVADLLGIKHILDRKPHTYSGGEYQRVAIARALITEPKLLLLDEPFKTLDAKIREAMISWIKGLHKRIGITVIYATHDPLEALSVGNKVMVLLNGVQKQLSDPLELLRRPIDLEVDEYISIPALNVSRGILYACMDGKAVVSLNGLKLNVIPGPRDCEPGREVIVAIRPQDIAISSASGTNALKGKVITVNYMGRNQLIALEVNGVNFRVVVDKSLNVTVGQQLYLLFKPDKIRLYDAQTLKLLT
ncbi:MAG: ABC transporter ATP-binding protein [Fervidicoccaceae archaeon]